MKTSQTEMIITFQGTELLRVTKPPGDYTIGRDSGCDIVCEGGGILRSHARMFVKYYETYIEDLGSSNGTFVAGQRLASDGSSTRIYPGQKVLLGQAELENSLRRRVAMKRMHSSVDLDALVRFIEEAQITAQLDHPGVAPGT